MSNRERTRAVLLPFATTFAGIGGIAFHAGHGPEHFLCIAIAAFVAVAGAFWSVWNRFFRHRPKTTRKLGTIFAWCDQDPGPRD